MNFHDYATLVGKRIVDDNAKNDHGTAHPLFVVQARKRLYGFDTDCVDTIAWLYDGEEVTAGGAGDLEERFGETGEEPEGYQRTAYVDQWEFVTACFTREAAEAYLHSNHHRHAELRVFVDSAYRNEEWIRLRAYFEALASNPKGAA